VTIAGWLTIVLFAVILTAVAIPFGSYLANVYSGKRVLLTPIFAGPERFLYKILRVDPGREQDWKAYAKSLIVFSLAGWLLLYLILRTQDAFFVPHSLNPLGFESAPWNVTFSTVSSFTTNTNWQYYSGETTMSYLSQMIGLTVQNWLSAGIGIVVAVALVRGIIGRSGKSIGNFWQDLVRTILYVLAPLSVIGAIVLVSQGVIANFSNYLTVHTVSGLTQTIAMGPVASQEAIKMLGTNGGGFFNVNSAHPFENPSGFTNFFQMLLILAIPASLTYTYGRIVGNRRQGWAIFSAMLILLGPETDPFWAAAAGFVMGIGMGFCNTTFIVAIQTSVGWHERGIGTGSQMFMRMLGMAVGAAIFGAIINYGVDRQLPGAGGLVNRMLDPATRDTLGADMLARLGDAVGLAAHGAFIAALVIAALTLMATLFLPARLSPTRTPV